MLISLAVIGLLEASYKLILSLKAVHLQENVTEANIQFHSLQPYPPTHNIPALEISVTEGNFFVPPPFM